MVMDVHGFVSGEFEYHLAKSEFIVVFRMVVFRPFSSDAIVVRVKSSDEDGICCMYFSPFQSACSHIYVRGTIVTSPFDVVKTLLQSSLFHQKHATIALAVIMGAPRFFRMLYTFVETGCIIRYALILESHLTFQSKVIYTVFSRTI